MIGSRGISALPSYVILYLLCTWQW